MSKCPKCGSEACPAAPPDTVFRTYDELFTLAHNGPFTPGEARRVLAEMRCTEIPRPRPSHG